jgi:dienelactone hydrolase
MTFRHQLLWLLALALMLSLIDLFFGRVFAKGFCFGGMFASLVAFWERGGEA